MHNYCLCDIKLLVHHVFYHNRVIFCQFFRLYQDVVSHLNKFPIQKTQFNKTLKIDLLFAFLSAVRFLSLVRVLSGDSRRTSPSLPPDLCLASIVRLSGLGPTTEHTTSVLVKLYCQHQYFLLSTSVLVPSTSVLAKLYYQHQYFLSSTLVLVLSTSLLVLLTSVIVLLTSVPVL